MTAVRSKLNQHVRMKVAERGMSNNSHLDWNNGLWLFGEDYSTIEKRWNNVMNENVNSSFGLVIKVVVVVETLHGTTAHHSVHLPHLIVLHSNNQTHRC